MSKRVSLPTYFTPILWSHDVARIDPKRHRKLLITQALNYGDLRHLRWLVRTYGRDGIRATIDHVPTTELRPRARRLARYLFGLERSRHARRRTH